MSVSETPSEHNMPGLCYAGSVIDFRMILVSLREWRCFLLDVCRSALMSRQALTIENLALRSQLALYGHEVLSHKRPKRLPTPAFRQLWVILSRFWTGWESALIVVKPETVIRWHRTAFRWYWARKSKPGRPLISRSTIALIKRIHRENPLWSPERIHDQMVALGMSDVPCPNTIARYIPATRRPPSENVRQSWKTFLANHMDATWAMDFFTVPTLSFGLLYVFVIIDHTRRQVVHIAVTR